MTFLKRMILTFVCVSMLQMSFAGEGMWLPLLLKSLNEAEMQAMGMKMTAEEIYSVNKGSLKDAIVSFGGFCTAEVISKQGLILTNHHCGYRQIQSHSSLEDNYLQDGFWAEDFDKELPNPGLTATFIVRIEDISKHILNGIADDLDPRVRQSMIDKKIEGFKASVELNKDENIVIRPFFKGNQYFMFVTMTYRDVRLVGAPPSSIGKFGADTDNWVWPRHTGDFSLFRIYAGPDNMPADYSEDNIPYIPKHSLPISIDGVAPDDFTMVFGFPGRTNQYLPSPAVQQIVDVLDPAKIAIRDKTLEVYNAAMRADPQVNIQYASKQSGISNAWKKWQGEVLGLTKTNAVKKKQDYENLFLKTIDRNPEQQKKYGRILADFKELYASIEPYALTRDYFNEITGRNVEIFRIASYFNRLAARYEASGQNGYDSYKARIVPRLESFYKDYRSEIDQQVFAALLEKYVKDIDQDYVPEMLTNWVAKYGANYENMAKEIYEQSVLTKEKGTMDLLSKSPEKVLETVQNDPIFQLTKNWIKVYNDKVSPKYSELNGKIEVLQRKYMKALMEVFPRQKFYPDANGTMRVSYGKVEPYSPRDAVDYGVKTYLSGVMEKYVPGDYEFDLPPKLIDLYEKKDYGRYSERGKMPVCFIGSNHTTGGNSGSPAIDAHGNLVGLNFDRAWEGTMSDINYNRRICRNIMVDIRYVLFIVDKFAGAQRLINEMELVHGKRVNSGNSGKQRGKFKTVPAEALQKGKIPQTKN